MNKEELYNKIDKFCNETDWGKYPTYEHALEEFINGIIAEETKELQKENAELKEALKGKRCSCMTYLNFKDLEKQLTNAKEIIREFMKYEINEYDGSLEIHFEELKKQAEQFLNNEVENV